VGHWARHRRGRARLDEVCVLDHGVPASTRIAPHARGATDAVGQLTNVLAETDAWEAIVTGSVLKPRLMRVVIHFQVIYTLACVSWLRHEFAEANARVEDKEGEEELRRFVSAS
jgi:hypothetical protein